jgi:predicted nucleic acid-binding protein
MGVVVDTSVWIDVERNRLTYSHVAERINNDAVYLAPPVVAELEYGVSRAKTDDQRNRRTAALAKIKKKPCLLVDKETGEMFGKLAAELDSRGTPSTHRVNDVWIAAVAIQNGFKVLTRNESDFGDIPGLDVIIV